MDRLGMVETSAKVGTSYDRDLIFFKNLSNGNYFVIDGIYTRTDANGGREITC